DVLSKYSEQAEEAAIARERMTRLDATMADLNSKAEQHMKQGNELFKRWEYEDAIKEYEDAITLRPNTLLALNAQYGIGQSWFRAGKYDAALATFTNLMEENPESTIAPVTELMLSQVHYAMKNNENPGITKIISDENTIVDPETGITYRKIKTFTGESDIITLPGSLKLSPNGKHLLCENTVVPMDGTAPFELIDYHSTGIQAHRGIWSPNGTQAAFYSGDALCVVPVSPETGHTTGPFKKIIDVELKYASHPGWSPDGKKLTYYGPGGDLWTIDADGNNLRQITKSDIREVGPAWSPDGKTIAYGTVHRHVRLYDIEKDKSSEFIDAGFRCFPVWAPDGKWILGDDFQKLHFYNLNDKSNFELATLKEVGTFFSWLQENNRMLFFRTSYHYAAGQKIASSKGGPSFEPVPLLINWGRAEWSENNNLIAVQGEDEKGEIAFSIVPLMGGESFLLNLDHLIDGKPFPFKISSGLEILLFNVDRDDGKEDLYAVPVSAEDARTTGPAVKIFKGWYREGAFNIKISLSPNGEKVALIQEDKI
ncbi:MAG: PD40 domain-containing protein, partial [Bacteroidales bacterium]|nr:PD40 domain-containing protein [Bacteroidales bacterium]